MNQNIKHIAIILGTFCIIYWFQRNEDIKTNYKRETYYEKFKLPGLVSAIIALIFTYTQYEINDIGINQIRPILRQSTGPKPNTINQDVYTELPDF